MRSGRLPKQVRPALAGVFRGSAVALALVMVLSLDGCATPDPHPASPSTPGDPDHPPAATLHGLEPNEPVPTDDVNRPPTSDINPYVPTNEPSK